MKLKIKNKWAVIIGAILMGLGSYLFFGPGVDVVTLDDLDVSISETIGADLDNVDRMIKKLWEERNEKMAK